MGYEWGYMVKFDEEWYRERVELEALRKFKAWNEIELSFRIHQSMWGVPCGPTLEMVNLKIIKEVK